MQPSAAQASTTGSVQGTVTDLALDAPLAGVCVYLYTAGGSYAGTGGCTAGAGNYAISGIVPGQYTIGVYDPAGTHPTTWYGNVSTKTAATLFTVAAGSATTGVDVAVAELPGIAGVVRDAVTNGRVQGACIYATQTTGGSATYASCSTAADGSYAVTGLAPGGYDVAFYDPAGLHVTTHVSATVQADRTTTGVDGLMPEITGIVGTVLDTGSGSPIANACAMLYTIAGAYVSGSYRCTDANGRFVIDGLTPGTYALAYYDPQARFVTQWYQGKTRQADASAVAIVANATTTVGAERVTSFGSAAGTVVDAAGAPAVDVCAYANDLDGKYTGVGSCTDATGHYMLAGLLPGQYKIAFYPSGTAGISTYWYRGRTSEQTADPVSITGLSTTQLATEALTRPDDTTPPAPVTGLQLSSSDGVIHLSWTNPNDADFRGVTIRRSAGSTAPASPTDGTAVAEVPRPGTSLDDSGVTSGQTYSYALFAHDAVPNYAVATTGSVSASDTPSALHECGTLTTNTTWSPAQAPVYILDCTVTVAPNTTLTLAPGTRIKANDRAALVAQGSLIGSGSDSAPVVLTSWRDDAVAGDTNGDGNATGPGAGDWGGVQTSPVDGAAAPTLSLHAVRVSYAATGVSASGSSVSVTNGAFAHLSGDGVAVASAVGVPTVSGNSVTGAAGNAISVASSSIDLGALDGNSGSGDGMNGVVLTADTVTVSSSLPWSGNLIPVVSSYLIIPPHVTMTAAPSTITKAETGAYFNVQGSLVATGTAASPVVLTSWRDDAVAGDTNGDGNATGPQAGDWYGVIAQPAGNGNPDPTIDLTNTEVRYASTGVRLTADAKMTSNGLVLRTVDSGVEVERGTASLDHVRIEGAQQALGVSQGTVSIRGRIAGNRVAITACPTSSNGCFVDATNVDWGASAGPGAIGAENSVCGDVVVSPWVGGGSDADIFAAVLNCDGSNELQSLTDSAAAADSAAAHVCDGYDPTACDLTKVLKAYYQCLSGAGAVLAEHSPYPIPNPVPTDSAADMNKFFTSLVVNSAIGLGLAALAPTPIGLVAGLAIGIWGAYTLFRDLTNAANSCVPHPIPPDPPTN